MRIEGKICSHSVQRELAGLHNRRTQERRECGGWLWDGEPTWFKRTIEAAERDVVSRGIVCVGEDTFVFRHADVELTADHPREMIQQSAGDKRMKLSKWVGLLMEVHHFTYEIFLPKNQLESDHTSTVYWKLGWVEGWYVLNNTVGMWSANSRMWDMAQDKWASVCYKYIARGKKERGKRI